MSKSSYHTLLLMFVATSLWAQPNCSLYEGKCKTACELYVNIQEYQGRWRAQQLYDSAISLCESFSYAHHERSVGFLKNGEFIIWKKYMDEAVKHNPKIYLGNRAWCRFKFLHDYEGALADLNALKEINNGFLGYSGDGDYDLRLIIALSYRELGHSSKALTAFQEYFYEKEVLKTGLSVGSYDYLHDGVTKFKLGNYDEALAAFKKQKAVYAQLPDTYYYISKIYYDKGDLEKYIQNINLAHDYTLSGYSRKDPYCEALDQVYLTDIITLKNNIEQTGGRKE